MRTRGATQSRGVYEMGRSHRGGEASHQATSDPMGDKKSGTTTGFPYRPVLLRVLALPR